MYRRACSTCSIRSTRPAIVRSATWDVVAWNDAAAATLTDYTTLSPQRRNILRLIFVDPHVRGVQANWERVARFAVGAFRADVARGGATQAVQAFVDEMRAASAEFDALARPRCPLARRRDQGDPPSCRRAHRARILGVRGERPARPDARDLYTGNGGRSRARPVAGGRARASAGRADARRMMVRVSSDECRHAVSPVAPSGLVAPLRPIAFRTDSQSNI